LQCRGQLEKCPAQNQLAVLEKLDGVYLAASPSVAILPKPYRGALQMHCAPPLNSIEELQRHAPVLKSLLQPVLPELENLTMDFSGSYLQKSVVLYQEPVDGWP
jgi:hypothetical protein